MCLSPKSLLAVPTKLPCPADLLRAVKGGRQEAGFHVQTNRAQNTGGQDTANFSPSYSVFMGILCTALTPFNCYKIIFYLKKENMGQETVIKDA